MPEPTFLVRRSARSRPAKVFRATTWRYSSFFRNSSLKSPLRSSSTTRWGPDGFRLRCANDLDLALPLSTRPPGPPVRSHRLGRPLHDVGDDAVRVDPLRLALEGQQDPVAQGRRHHP